LDIKRKAVRGVAWSGLQRGGAQVVSFVVFTLLARLLAPEAFGLIAIANVFITFVNIFLDQGFGSAIIQREELQDGHLDTAFWSAVGMGAALMAAGLFSAGFIARLYSEPTLEPVLRWVALNVLILALGSTQRSVLNRELAFDKLAIRRLAAEAVGGVTGVAMAFAGYGVWSLVGRNITRDLTSAGLLWRLSDWRPGLRATRRHFKEMSWFGANIIGDRLLTFVNRDADKLLIGYFLGATALGYYSIGARLVRLLLDLTLGTFVSVAFPVFSRIQVERERIRSAFYQATRYTSAIGFPAFVGLSLVAGGAVPLLFGAKWLPAIEIVQALAFLGVVHAMGYFIPPLLLAEGRPDWGLALSFLRAVLNLTFILILVRWGVVAVALGFVLREAIMLPLKLWAVKQVIDLDVVRFFRQLTPIAGATLVMAAAVFVVDSILEVGFSPAVLVLGSILSGIVAYGLSLRLLAPKLSRQGFELAMLMLPDGGRESGPSENNGPAQP
jgi:PST family polysaccharide transporter